MADQQDKRISLQLHHELGMPQRGAFRPGRQISGVCLTGITKADRHNTETFRIIKDAVIHIQPFSKGFPTGIIPWHSRFMDLSTGCLTDDDYF